ncbi:MAG: type II toxin-antitoxin system RelE/ParE family toxin [Chitinophagaceae bacterium]
MVKESYQVVWTKPAQKEMKQAFDYISKDSIKNAEKVITTIAAMVDKASDNPQIYPPDKFKIDNDGSYRAFEKHRYRIAYRFSNKVLRVLRVRHTSREPLQY